MKRKRVAIFYDGSNFYYKLKKLDLHDQLKFDFISFNHSLHKSGKLVSVDYYIGAVRVYKNNPKSKQMHERQIKLFSYLTKQKVKVHKGYIMKTGNSYYEKGVDVQIAIDLLIGAYEDRYEQAILISSDTDLLPAIKKCQSLGKSVCYVGFKKAMSYALKNQCDKSILLTKEDIEPFVQTS